MDKILEDLNWRYATKKFDATKKVSPADFNVIKESLRLVPSSYGLQPLKYIVVESQTIREQLVSATFGQLQVIDASHLIVICSAVSINEKDIDCHIDNVAKKRDIKLEKVKGYGDFMKKTIAGFFTGSAIAVSIIVAVTSYQLYKNKYATIDAQLKEISGIEFDKNNKLWAINDGGDQAKLYQINKTGGIDREITITNAKNIDWEDMTQDDFGHFFLGDFGNNDNLRKWLTIYKIENPIDIKSVSIRLL